MARAGAWVSDRRRGADALATLTALLLLGVTISGCIATTDRNCAEDEKVPTRAQWTEPGLFEAFPHPGRQGEWDLVWTEPEGLPVEDPVRGTIHLDFLRWFEPLGHHPGNPPIFFGADGNVSGIYIDVLQLDEIRAAFVALAENVTEADQATREAWASEFLSGRTIYSARWSAEHNRDVIYYLYSTTVTGPFRIEEIYQGLLHEETDRNATHDPFARDETRLGDWWFRFPAPERRAEHVVDPSAHFLRVDVLDRATHRVPMEAGTGTAEHLERLNATLDGLAVPRGDMHDLRFHSTCP